MHVATSRTLGNLEAGACSFVASLSGPEELTQRLMEIGIIPGSEIQVIRRAPFGFPIEVDVCGARFSLGRESADAIAVRSDG